VGYDAQAAEKRWEEEQRKGYQQLKEAAAEKLRIEAQDRHRAKENLEKLAYWAEVREQNQRDIESFGKSLPEIHSPSKVEDAEHRTIGNGGYGGGGGGGGSRVGSAWGAIGAVLIIGLVVASFSGGKSAPSSPQSDASLPEISEPIHRLAPPTGKIPETPSPQNDVTNEAASINTPAVPPSGDIHYWPSTPNSEANIAASPRSSPSPVDVHGSSATPISEQASTSNTIATDSVPTIHYWPPQNKPRSNAKGIVNPPDPIAPSVPTIPTIRYWPQSKPR
jgi:hypothetical protein